MRPTVAVCMMKRLDQSQERIQIRNAINENDNILQLALYVIRANECEFCLLKLFDCLRIDQLSSVQDTKIKGRIS